MGIFFKIFLLTITPSILVLVFYFIPIYNFLGVPLFIIFLLLTVALIAKIMVNYISAPTRILYLLTNKIEKGEDISVSSTKEPGSTEITGLVYRIYKHLLADQKKIEKENRKLNNILDVMGEGIIFLDNNGLITHCNNWMKKNLNLSYDNGDTHILNSTTNIELLALFSDIVDKNSHYHTRKNIGDKIFEIFTKPIDEEKLLVIHDITNNLMYESLKTDLIGNISHELKTPMAMIMNYTETLLHTKELDEDTRNKFILTTYNATERLNKLVNDIINLHKIESLRPKISLDKIENTDLKTVYEELNTYYSFITNKNIIFDIQTEEAKVSREHLLSVITNLIDNAIKYTSGQNISVSISKTTNETVDGNNIVISVNDEGPPIPETERTKVFERFYTMTQSRSREKAGSGIGLSIVKNIATLYNGSVQLRTNKYGGNSFLITLKEFSRHT